MSALEFIYDQEIGDSFFKRIAMELGAGLTVVLIGPRYVGKRFVMSRVLHEFSETEAMKQDQVVVATFLESPPPGGELLAGLADPFLGDVRPTFMTAEAALVEFEKTNKNHENKKIVFMAANIDALPRMEAEKFLGQLGALAGPANRKPGILLTTEAHGPELLLGDSPRIIPDRVYVLQRFDLLKFTEFAEKYLDYLRFEMTDNRSTIIKALYQQTGGRIYFLRCLIWSLFDRWASQEGREKPQLKLKMLAVVPKIEHIPWNHYFRYVTRLISRAPDLWPALLELKRNGQVKAVGKNPSLLELAGIAVREQRDGSDWLLTSGDLIRGFIERHYTPQRVAELYSLTGEWKQAFDQLRELRQWDPTQLVRPSSIDDVVDTEHAVRRLGASLHQLISLDQLSAQGTEAIRLRFKKGCHLLLGYGEVSFWVRDRRCGPWRRLVPRHGPVDRRVSSVSDLDVAEREPTTAPSFYESILNGLPEPSEEGPANYQTLDKYLGAAAQIDAPHSDLLSAVVIRAAGGGNQPLMSKARQEILEILLKDFLQAHHDAKNIARILRQSKVRHQLSQIVMEVLKLLGSEVQRLDQTLAIVAEQLRDRPFEYKRVLISLVDPTEKAIVGAYEASDDPHQTMRRLTKYPLNDADASMHARAIRDRKSIREPDLAHAPNVHRPTIRKTGAKAGAVVPLLIFLSGDPDQPTPLGTLWCERADELAPSLEEVEELEEFGKKLAVVLMQSKRVQLLQSALDQQQQPILILDGKDRPVFTNRLSAKMMDDPITPGWRHHHIDGPNPLDGQSGRFIEGLRTSVFQTKERGRRQVRHLDITGERPGDQSRIKEWVSLLTDVIRYCPEIPAQPGENGHSIWKWKLGTVCEVQRLSILYRIFDSLKRLHCNIEDETNPREPGQATKQIVENVGILLTNVLGHSRALLYQLDHANRRVMDLRMIYPGLSESLERFSRFRKIELEDDQRWHAIDAKEPFALSMDPDRGDGEEYFTEYGLRVKNLVRPAIREFLAEVKERSWIDFPLMAGDLPWGMIVVDCDPQYLPEDFEFLKVFTMLISSLLEGIQLQDDRFNALFIAQYENTMNSQLMMIHNILKPLGDYLEPLLSEHARASQLHRGKLAIEGSERSPAGRVSGESREIDRWQSAVRNYYEVHKLYLDRLASSLRKRTKLKIESVDLVGLVLKVLRKKARELEQGGGLEWVLERKSLTGLSVTQEHHWSVIAASSMEVESHEAMTAELDAMEMGIILEELVDNAQHNRADERPLKLRVRLSEHPSWPTSRIHLEVADNGCGIQPEDREMLFEPLFTHRADKTQGLGMGLCNVRLKAQAHGGEIVALESELGSGATFRLNLPRFHVVR